MASGSEAKRGDIVRNVTTQEVGTMTDPMNSGRIRVRTTKGGTPAWERWNVEVALKFLGVTKNGELSK